MTDPAESPPTCPDCAGQFTDGPLCSYCLKGLRFAGEGFVFSKSPLSCPACAEALHQIDYHGVTIDTCARCEGAWFDLGEIEEVVQAARQAAKAGSFVATPPNASAGAATRERAYVPCPKCGTLMNRQNWEHRSGILVDWCKRCGVWLDGGELAQMRSWAARTPEGPPPPPVEPKPRPDSNATASVWMQDIPGHGPSGFIGAPGPGLGSLLTSLLESLFRF